MLHLISGRNITDVFYQALIKLKTQSDYYTKDNILELNPALIHVEKPLERCLIIPHRNNNIVQSLAETLWVLGGRDDLNFLVRYLPRAGEFSDDGITWRGAYGKRLRSYFGGVDQVKKVLTVLREDHFSARGVMSIFDPATDIDINYKDVPCNNWIQFSLRENKLNMHVTVRANDLIWGFSGVNFFEWTTLQELISSWLNVEVGEYYHFAGFLQLYKRHFERADRMLHDRISQDIYTHQEIRRIPIDIKESSFEKEMADFFAIEQMFNSPHIKKVNYISSLITNIESKYLQHCLSLMLSWILIKNKQYDECHYIFEQIAEDHMKIATANYLTRDQKIPTPLRDEFSKTLRRYCFDTGLYDSNNYILQGEK